MYSARRSKKFKVSRGAALLEPRASYGAMVRVKPLFREVPW